MKKLLCLLFALMAIIACSESGTEDGGGQEKPKHPEVTLDATTVDFTTDGGSSVVTFTTSDAWTAEAINNRADAWCSVSPTSGNAGNAKITIAATANNTTDDRTATIVIKSGSTQKTIAVSQKQKDALTVTSSKFEVSADGGLIEIEVKANIDFNVEIDESAKSWVTHRSTRAMKTSTLIFEVDKNSDSEKRKANIAITSGKLKETVTIYQESNKPSIVLTQNEYTVPSAGETIAVEVKSNVDVTVEMPKNADWITENTTRAVSTNTYYFDIDPNEEYDNRTTEIKFTNKENKLSETVTITQLQRDAIVVAESEYFFYEEGGKLDFEIKTNLEIEVSISEDAQSWIKYVETRGLQSNELHFDIATNDSDNDREGIISIIGGDIVQRIIVKQINLPTLEIGHNPEPYFSETVELMGLIWSLAGAEAYEYYVHSVANSADRYFASFKDHKAVELAKQCSDWMAIKLGIQTIVNNEGDIVLDPNYLDETGLNKTQQNDILVAVNDFYKESKFHEWFISTQKEQEQAIASFKSICNFDYTWLDSFYGKNDKISSRIILGFIAGHHGFGPSIMRKDGILVLSPVLGHVYQKGGNVIYNNDIRNLVHEFSHPFCNPLIDAHWNSISKKVNEVFFKVRDVLASNGYYDAYNLISESFVRASVIRYMMTHNQEYKISPSQTLAIEESRGFLFVKPLLKVLERREQEADKYPTMADFMPEIIKAINNFDLYDGVEDETDTSADGYVDLGIVMNNGKKLYFATKNLGEASPEGFGSKVYRWGATEEGGKAWISDTGMWEEGHKLDAAHDIATITLGEKWHIPSIEEWELLVENCYYERKEADESGYGVAGYFFYNKSDFRKYIFLPVSSNNELRYWTSQIAKPYNGICVARIFNSYGGRAMCGTTAGLDDPSVAVRPVFVE